MKLYNPNILVPSEIVQAAHRVKVFLATNNATSGCGLGEVYDLQRQLDEVTRERDQFKATCSLLDKLRNWERGFFRRDKS